MKNITLLSVLFLISCNPKVITKMDSLNTVVHQKLNANIVFIENDTIQFKNLLGTLEIKDNGLTKNCSYDSIKAVMIKKAEVLGANCLVVEKYKMPDNFSTCHRMKARMYWIENPYDYETIISWSAHRPLKVRDFKGTTINRSFEAVTSSKFVYQYRLNQLSRRLEIAVETRFDCRYSYFKQSKDEAETLLQQQIRFDITEIYARIFFKRLMEISHWSEKFNRIDAIYYEVSNEMIVKQSELNNEIHHNHYISNKWTEWTTQELKSLSAFADKSFLSDKITFKELRDNAARTPVDYEL